MKKWQIIKDENIRHVWVDPDTKEQIYISPDWYQDNGTPVNGETAEDFIYSHTEIIKS